MPTSSLIRYGRHASAMPSMSADVTPSSETPTPWKKKAQMSALDTVSYSMMPFRIGSRGAACFLSAKSCPRKAETGNSLAATSSCFCSASTVAWSENSSPRRPYNPSTKNKMSSEPAWSGTRSFSMSQRCAQRRPRRTHRSCTGPCETLAKKCIVTRRSEPHSRKRSGKSASRSMKPSAAQMAFSFAEAPAETPTPIPAYPRSASQKPCAETPQRDRRAHSKPSSSASPRRSVSPFPARLHRSSSSASTHAEHSSGESASSVGGVRCPQRRTHASTKRTSRSPHAANTLIASSSVTPSTGLYPPYSLSRFENTSEAIR
mmetsp:Transcript_591/g.2133  ORF Transcript_591/g.2133 Transcript_591/m.2133 type:complete len:318 (-) Transcript_591:3326-4279(-)